MDALFLKLPVMGVLIRKVAVAKFTRTLGTMISSGVPILDGLDIVAKTAGNKIVENAIYKVAQSISEGKTIAEPLEESGVFPSMVCQMIAVGEQSGSIDTMLNKVADFYDDEVDDAVGNLTAMMEPLLMLFLGTTVGGLVIAMYLPIFSDGRCGWLGNFPMAVTPVQKNLSNVPRRLLSWYLAIRLFVVCLFLGGTILYQLQQGSWVASPAARYLTYLTLFAILHTLVSGFILVRIRRYRHFINAQLSWDLIFVTLIIYLTGGVDSLYSFLFILVIIAASVFCPRHQLLVVASASSILYGSLLDLQFYGYLSFPGSQPLVKVLDHYDVFYAVFLHVGAFFLTALLSGALAERLRRSEEARERREIDYGELERLNQAILANINSGLMVVNSAGRIRSFNKAASKITGRRLEEVYNRPVEALFPEFDTFDPLALDGVERGEMHFKRDMDETLTLGYSASHVVDRDNDSLGLLIAFQDLTDYKALEEQLKRADRLAAVGRLASGLAHEIRNPLASISGSVQLLLEDDNVSPEDRRLMNIVIKEADRLSRLLSDFLNFARPAPLQIGMGRYLRLTR